MRLPDYISVFYIWSYPMHIKCCWALLLQSIIEGKHVYNIGLLHCSLAVVKCISSNSANSSFITAISGICQGSVLCPMLFLYSQYQLNFSHLFHLSVTIQGWPSTLKGHECSFSLAEKVPSEQKGTKVFFFNFDKLRVIRYLMAYAPSYIEIFCWFTLIQLI